MWWCERNFILPEIKEKNFSAECVVAFFFDVQLFWYDGSWMMDILPVIAINLFILVLCFLCFFQSLDGSFTFDDQVNHIDPKWTTQNNLNLLTQVAIVKNSDVTNQHTSYAKIFSNDFWGHNLTDPDSHKSYRPLTILLFHWEHRLFGLNAVHMKAVNFFLHCLICVLLGHVLPILFPTIQKQWLWLATVLFAVHPIHCEVILQLRKRNFSIFSFDHYWTAGNLWSCWPVRVIVHDILDCWCLANGART